MQTLFGLPEKVLFCKKCVISNQRPNSAVEVAHLVSDRKSTIFFGDDGIWGSKSASAYAKYQGKYDASKVNDDGTQKSAPLPSWLYPTPSPTAQFTPFLNPQGGGGSSSGGNKFGIKIGNTTI